MTRNLTPGNRSTAGSQVDLAVERADDVDRHARGPGVGPEVGQGVVQPPVALDQVVVDQDQLDVGRLGARREAVVAGRGEDRVVAELP